MGASGIVFALGIGGITYLGVTGFMKFRKAKKKRNKLFTHIAEKPRTLLAYEILHEIIMLLTSKGLVPPEMDHLMNKMANQRSEELAIEFSHEGVGKAMSKVFIAGLDDVGETVGKNQPSASSLVKWFLKSPKHKKTMLGGHWQYIGIGIDKTESYFSVLYGYDKDKKTIL